MNESVINGLALKLAQSQVDEEIAKAQVVELQKQIAELQKESKED
ncbi:hypothetical protein WFA24289_01948 [Periweissella fabaria]|uniref:Uncharacterized protein n=1 Tax=Periweissella fabaria TaxID=546157 RepID=A0ABM8Z8U8_9LACO|nr:hypothetical protein [Periweissella fabaria]CAH0417587.1 hypothetical protein WFA24289_01948 [Periweissella fabaria]